MRMPLAEALLRRKELNQKVAQLQAIKGEDIFKIVVERKQASEGWDDIRARVPRVSFQQVTAEYDHYARQLRQIDAVIQRANWSTEVEVSDDVMSAYTEQESLKSTEIPVTPGRFQN